MATLDSWLKGCTDAVFHQEIGSTSVAINNSFLVHTLIASHPPLEEGGNPQGCGWPAGKSCPWPGSGRPAGTGAWWSRSPPDPSAWPELSWLNLFQASIKDHIDMFIEQGEEYIEELQQQKHKQGSSFLFWPLLIVDIRDTRMSTTGRALLTIVSSRLARLIKTSIGLQC